MPDLFMELATLAPRGGRPTPATAPRTMTGHQEAQPGDEHQADHDDEHGPGRLPRACCPACGVRAPPAQPHPPRRTAEPAGRAGEDSHLAAVWHVAQANPPCREVAAVFHPPRVSQTGTG